MRTRKIYLAILITFALMPALLLFLARGALRRYEGLKPGDRLPDARLLSQDRSQLDTASWRGTPTLLVIFHPGCPSCLLEIESLASIAPAFPELRIVLLSSLRDMSVLQSLFSIYYDV